MYGSIRDPPSPRALWSTVGTRRPLADRWRHNRTLFHRSLPGLVARNSYWRSRGYSLTVSSHIMNKVGRGSLMPIRRFGRQTTIASRRANLKKPPADTPMFTAAQHKRCGSDIQIARKLSRQARTQVRDQTSPGGPPATQSDPVS